MLHKKIYHHVVMNMSNQDIGGSINLASIDAVEALVGITFKCVMSTGKAIDVYALTPEQRQALVDAWEAFHNAEDRRI